MIDDEFLKQLQFTHATNNAEETPVWRQKLAAIETYLNRQSFPEPVEDSIISAENSQNNHPQHKLRFKLALESTYTADETIPKTTCCLQLYELVDHVTLHAVQTREALDIFYIDNIRHQRFFSNLDSALLDTFKTYFYPNTNGELRIVLPAAIEMEILIALCQQNLLFYFDSVPKNYQWLPSTTPARFKLTLQLIDEEWKIWGKLIGASEDSIDLWEIQAVTSGGIARQNERLFAYEQSAYPWIETLLTSGGIRLPDHALHDFLCHLLNLLDITFIEWPDNIHIKFNISTPQPIFYVKTKNDKKSFKTHIEGFAWFRSETIEYPSDIHQYLSVPTRPKILGIDIVRRDLQYQVSMNIPDRAMEQGRLEELNLCAGLAWNVFHCLFQVKLAQAIATLYALLHQGWEVWAENLQIKIIKEMQIQLMTHPNWFEVDLMAGKPAQKIPSWQFIHLLQKKRLFIQLSDGSLGLPPEEWYQTFARLFALRSPTSASNHEDNLRFSTAHAFHFAQLAEMAEKSENIHFQADAAFENIRREILNINGLQPLTPASSFQLTLRPYQALGLSWLQFLGRARLGGCLADDMGLGKTIQVLAYLDLKRHETKKQARFKSLLVVPRSLLEHWLQEAKNCAPRLKIYILRAADMPQLDTLIHTYDLLLVSYGLVRLHVETLQQFQFDLLALDEAQQIKNASAQVTLAIHQLRGVQRLAISGTPIENHIGELFSLFEFLNPGLTNIALLKSASAAQSEDIENNAVLEQFLRGIRPLILRRLKQEVAKELPDKLEQIVALPMEAAQSDIYISIKNYYQEQLKSIDANTFYDKFFFLEGLLRLRQAACHPLLLTNTTASSNKFEFLIEKLKTLVCGNHKAILFSQFTALLKLFQAKLDELDIPYEYLDGQSQNRLDIVTRFQTSSHIPILLASIKTGGLGFNLTAADYCFILDPWWNPAIEQQAVDRIHRIGQEKVVNIYRIVSQNTVEEKMLLLKERKQKIADQLMAADHAFLEQLNFDDFQFLLQ